MTKITKFFKFLLFSSFLGLFLAALFSTAIYFYLKPELPSMEALKDVRFQVPLRVYSRDEKLIAEFGEKRRTPIKYADVPDAFIKAVLAAEDQDFFKHSGIDIKGLARAAKLLIQNKGEIRGGGSTITMQLTRALFLSKEQSFKRKFKEIILALQIEQELSKEEILELYFNEIYLGKRAYGIQAAANVYYNKNIDQLTLAQLAMIAGLPKAPSSFNPINNPERALIRRDWILKRMLALSFISEQQYNTAINEELSAKDYGQSTEIEAPYVAEMIRNDLYAQFGEAVYTEGYKAFATIDSKLQSYANRAVNFGIHEYDERHGYKGVIKNINAPELDSLKITFLEKNFIGKEQPAQKIQNLLHESHPKEQTINEHYNLTLLASLLEQTQLDTNAYFENIKTITPLEVALTLFIDEEKNTALLLLKNNSIITLEAEQVLWAAPFIDRNTIGEVPEKISQILKSGDLIYLRKNLENKWRLAQIPDVQGALVAIKPIDGSVLALVGGYDHNMSKYNRVIQGGRQAGSTFKPFIYTKALEEGFTAASIINDAPVVFDDAALEETWRPENSGGNFYGPTRLRQALYRSRNLVSIRILSKLGINSTIESMERFGFEKEQLPANLSLALGSASLTPMQIANGFTVFANGGYRVFPYYLQEVKNFNDETIFKMNPVIVCPACPDPLPKENTEEMPEQETLLAPKNTQVNSEPSSDNNNVATDLATTLNEPVAIKKAESIIEPRVNYIIDNILADVIKRGTGTAALSLGRNDLRGKTGTTNEQVDAWFAGYNTDIVASAWMGFDTPKSLGQGEYGAVAALPIWKNFMENALANTEEKTLAQPSGLVTVKINSKTGEAAKPGEADAIFEIFREEYAPQLSSAQQNTSIHEQEENLEIEQLF